MKDFCIWSGKEDKRSFDFYLSGGGGSSGGGGGGEMNGCDEKWTPKPVSGESGSGGGEIDNKSLCFVRRELKESTLGLERIISGERKKRSSLESDPIHHDEASKNRENIVTLQLLPEKTEGEGSVNNQNGGRKRAELESWVTVESVTDNCTEWVNEAYKKMLMVVGEAKTAASRLSHRRRYCAALLKQEMPMFSTVFSCKVRLQYMWNKEKLSRTLPCDVWKIDGGFAWRLDVDAALSLGREE
ncbi:hypothetical protein F3Y22_tig00110402pilonHSYRG00079 [Hibiscus syriacus]|uniref:DUF7950 domain-containing protein n=1 Tax=Hibiscus syriacus TaxID=106335 RepID=A0A6A3ANU1_HIBSY|nr:hypothetical protein F3Y22_tig00110402pilonHSYRG00079 [Hibiscus syriacus]